MKKSTNILKVVLLILISNYFISCNKEIDNWDYPSSTVSGQFLYNGEPVQIKGTASDAQGSNMLQLHQVGEEWDPGYIKMFAREDGSYTINTFDGDYYLVITPGSGPWQSNSDTLRFTLKGEISNVNFNITPYFWISDFNNTYNDSVFTATFDLQQIVSEANFEKVVINLGTTSIVDNTSRVYEKVFTGLGTGTNTISLDLKSLTNTQKESLASTGYLYARIGVKTVNVTDYIYSKTVQLE